MFENKLSYKEKRAVLQLSKNRDREAYEDSDGFIIVESPRATFSIKNLFDVERVFGERGLQFVLRA